MVINKNEFRLNLNEKEETLGKNGSYLKVEKKPVSSFPLYSKNIGERRLLFLNFLEGANFLKSKQLCLYSLNV